MKFYIVKPDLPFAVNEIILCARCGDTYRVLQIAALGEIELLSSGDSERVADAEASWCPHCYTDDERRRGATFERPVVSRRKLRELLESCQAHNGHLDDLCVHAARREKLLELALQDLLDEVTNAAEWLPGDPRWASRDNAVSALAAVSNARAQMIGRIQRGESIRSEQWSAPFVAHVRDVVEARIAARSKEDPAT